MRRPETRAEVSKEPLFFFPSQFTGSHRFGEQRSKGTPGHPRMGNMDQEGEPAPLDCPTRRAPRENREWPLPGWV